MRQASQQAVTRQFHHLRGCDALAEEHARRLRQLMGLVKDHRVARGQQLGGTFVLQHDIGEKQMVIDHHHISLLRIAARRHHVALLVIRAVLAETILPRRCDVLPHAGVFRHALELGTVTRCRRAHALDDDAQILHIVARTQARLRLCTFQMVMAHVVGAAFKQGNRNRGLQRAPHSGDVAVKQLILQILGAGREDHLATGQQRRHQIGDGLAGAGTGLQNGHAFGFDGSLHRLGHLKLARTKFKAGNRLGERAGLGKQCGQQGRITLVMPRLQ